MSPPTPTPLALVAELTHRCPLHCVYCSNPQEAVAHPFRGEAFHSAGEIALKQRKPSGLKA